MCTKYRPPPLPSLPPNVSFRQRNTHNTTPRPAQKLLAWVCSVRYACLLATNSLHFLICSNKWKPSQTAFLSVHLKLCIADVEYKLLKGHFMGSYMIYQSARKVSGCFGLHLVWRIWREKHKIRFRRKGADVVEDFIARMLLFCPTCSNVLTVEEGTGPSCYRFACQTCPYVYNITKKVRNLHDEILLV